jgi:hypothetical protein
LPDDPAKTHKELAGRKSPCDETVMAISDAVKVQARDRRKSEAKSLTLQKGCKAIVILRIVRRVEAPKRLPCGSNLDCE